MKDVYLQEFIRKAVFRDGKSKRQIARELGIHRNTVSRLLNSQGPQTYQLKQAKAKPLIGDFLPLIESWLSQDEAAPRKQCPTAHWVYERLRDEYGYAGSER